MAQPPGSAAPPPPGDAPPPPPGAPPPAPDGSAAGGTHAAAPSSNDVEAYAKYWYVLTVSFIRFHVVNFDFSLS